MRPLPTNPEPLPATRSDGGVLVGPTRTLELGPPSPSINQRRNSCGVQRAYPWLLLTSTAMAAVFCALYITKPVLQAGAAPATLSGPLPAIGGPAEESTVKSSPSALPGDATNKPSVVEPQALASTDDHGFEETNLRIQHVLGATGPDGQDLGRITLDVPVLYQSGSVRWTREDVSKARSLLARIEDYQNKSRSLRDEAVHLISEWDALIVNSIPETTLRADSPTLPENQGAGTATEAPLKSTDSIEIDAR
jgi:hypothetical protein